jgi:hypothetical protein
MWMSHSCSQVCMGASSTPYENGAARREYPVGYGLTRGRSGVPE